MIYDTIIPMQLISFNEAEKTLLVELHRRKIANENPCTVCKGKGIIDNFVPEFNLPIYTHICLACRGWKITLTDEENEFLSKMYFALRDR